MDKFKKKIKLVSRELKYKGSIMNIYDDTVDVDGHIVHWDYMGKCDAAAVVPVLSNGNILMVRQYRLAVDKWTLEIPAGKLDQVGEDYLVCARRELEEEAGYKSDNIEFLCDVYTASAFTSEVVRVFVATNLIKGSQHFDRDEEVLVEEWTPSDLKKAIYNGELKDGKTVSGLMTYFTKFNIQ